MVLERFFTLNALQAHYDLSLVTHSLRNHSLDLSHDEILLGEQKAQEAGDEETVANGSRPANPIHLSSAVKQEIMQCHKGIRIPHFTASWIMQNLTILVRTTGFFQCIHSLLCFLSLN